MLSDKKINKYINGNCNIFALALFELNTSLSISVKFTTFINKGKSLEVISHAWCENQKGIFIDARGLSLREGLSIKDSNKEFIKIFYEGKNSFIEKNAHEKLYLWTISFIKSEKKLKQLIETAKNDILKSNFLNYI